VRIVIIGAGPAGVRVVETVRSLSRAPEIVMLSAERSLPYSPPAMMDHFLTGSRNHLWLDRGWPGQMALDYRAGVRAVGVDPEAREVTLSTEERLEFDRLVIASGGGLYAPVAGANLPGVFNFKSLSAAKALVSLARGGSLHRVIVVGAGFIGVEIALLLRALGLEVLVIEKLGRVMASMLDPDTSEQVVALLRQRDLRLLLDTEVVRFVGPKRAVGVELSSGEVLRADAFIAATSTRPQIGFLLGSEIARHWGVKVDDHLRTSAHGIFAAGDAVEATDRFTGESCVSANFPNALEQGRVVGLNLIGHDVRYEGSERLNSLSHIGLPVVVVGIPEGDEVLRWRRKGCLRTFYVKGDRLVGFQLVGDIRGAGWLRSLVNGAAPLGRIKARLLDRSFGSGGLTWSAMA
jgi:NADPH-dependent 2,4-dienoyl-CoA reductase/sulfur reductase-like enzyme